MIRRQFASKPALPEPTVVERMADAMRRLRFNGRPVTAEVLAGEDFTAEEIATHGAAARDLAIRASVRQVGA